MRYGTFEINALYSKPGRFEDQEIIKTITICSKIMVIYDQREDEKKIFLNLYYSNMTRAIEECLIET